MHTMIVADDERWIRERITSSIDWAKAGVKVAGEAADGEEALALAIEIKPEIIITDIRMPGLSGLDFLRQLYKAGIRAKLIIISGYSDFKYAQKAIKLGVSDYILKPVENAELLTIVKKCVRQIEAENFRNHIIEQAAFQKDLKEKLAGYADADNSRKGNTIEKALAFIGQKPRKPVGQLFGVLMLEIQAFCDVIDARKRQARQFYSIHGTRRAEEFMRFVNDDALIIRYQ